MTYFESLRFVFQLIVERLDPPTIVWAAAALIASLAIGHVLAGRMWNTQWKFSTNPLVMAASVVIAVMFSFAVMFWSAADRSVSWVELQQAELTRQFVDSGARNRRIMRETQTRLGPEHSGSRNSVTLNDESELLTLALSAATEVTCPLANQGPLGPDAPCRVRDPMTVAEEVVRSIPPASYPVTVAPKNRWSEAAVAAQVSEAMSYATTRVRAGMFEIRNLLLTLIIGLFVLQILISSFAAVSNIRVEPKYQ